MNKVQDATVEYLKKLVSKTNFLTVYDFAVLRGITNLSSYITSTIIKPAEVAAQIFALLFLIFFILRLFGGESTELLILT